MIRRTACILLLAVTLLVPAAAQACPNCAASMPGTKNPGSDAAPANADAAPKSGLADGFYYSILLMLAVPYTLAGVGGYAIYRAMKRRAGDAAVAASPTDQPITHGSA